MKLSEHKSGNEERNVCTFSSSFLGDKRGSFTFTTKVNLLLPNCEIEFIFSNNPKDILKYTKNVLACDIHTRERTKALLKDADIILGLDGIILGIVIDNALVKFEVQLVSYQFPLCVKGIIHAVGPFNLFDP